MASDARLDEPMSDARLREIRKGIEFNQMGMDEDEALFAISDLLAEVMRLRALAALLAEQEQADSTEEEELTAEQSAHLMEELEWVKRKEREMNY